MKNPVKKEGEERLYDSCVAEIDVSIVAGRRDYLLETCVAVPLLKGRLGSFCYHYQVLFFKYWIFSKGDVFVVLLESSKEQRQKFVEQITRRNLLLPGSNCLPSI